MPEVNEKRWEMIEMISNGNCRMAFALCLVILVFFLSPGIFSVACTPKVPVTEPPVTQPPVTQPPADQPSEPPTLPPPQPAKWSADGVITAEEYTKAKSFGDYEIQWSSDDEYIYIAMKAKTTGWVALGIQPGSMMKDADMLLGFVKDGKTTASDHFSTGSYGPHSADIELGGTNDILEFGGQEKDGYTLIEFKRLLNTSDKYDIPVSNGINKIIWSYGLDDQLTKKHTTRGYGEIDL